jgi:hypothetical protein
MNINPYGNLLIEDIEYLENTLGFDLPDDYVEFLIKNNGGKIQDSCIYIEKIQEFIFFDVFYGISLPPKALNLYFWFNEFKDDMPKNSLVIADEIGGGLFLLVNLETDYWDKGVYYWDDSYRFPSSSDDDNCYFIAPTFTEFISKIQANT